MAVSSTVHRVMCAGRSPEEIDLALAPLVSEPIEFDRWLTYLTASMHKKTPADSLSFSDCACLTFLHAHGANRHQRKRMGER